MCAVAPLYLESDVQNSWTVSTSRDFEGDERSLRYRVQFPDFESDFVGASEIFTVELISI